MNSIINFISDNETVIMIILFIVVIMLVTTVFIIDYINNKKKKNDMKELFIDNKTNVEDAFKEILVENEPFEDTTTIIMDEEININKDENEFVIKYVEEDEELEKTKAQLELKNLKEELIKAELQEKAIALNIDAPLKDEENIKESIIDSFENQQEENAIISLQQFNEVSDRIYDDNEITQYKDEGNEPISIEELDKLYKQGTNIVKQEPAIEPIVKTNESPEIPIVLQNNNETQKFKNSPIISPVHGINNTETLSTIVLENTANYDRLSEEIRKTNEFLNELREFRKNL